MTDAPAGGTCPTGFTKSGAVCVADGNGTGEDKGYGSAPDASLPGMPTLYEPKYPDGLGKIWNDRKAQLQGTAMGGLASRLLPTGLGRSGYPSIKVPLDVGFMDAGEADLSPPDWVWDFAGVVIVISALLLARALVFGG